MAVAGCGDRRTGVALNAQELQPTPHALRVHPAALTGQVRVPGDKSIAHRALLVAAFADGPIGVRGLPRSADVRATARALAAAGLDVDLAPSLDGALAGELGGELHGGTLSVDCGNSGTTMRLLAGVLATVVGPSVLDGDASLRRRPMDRVAAPLQQMGAGVVTDGGRPPLEIRGGPLRGIEYDSPVASAQVKSAVLFAGLCAAGPTTVTSPLPSRDHTERLLDHLGADVRWEILEDGRERVRVAPGTLQPATIDVPGDPSGAAFWLIAAACAADGGGVSVDDVCCNPRRLGAVKVLRDMGAQVAVDVLGDRAGEPVGTIAVRPSRLRGATVSGATVVDALDELPVLAVAGALTDDAAGLDVRDAQELRVKESDRIAAVAAALGALGVEVEQRPDGFRVPGRQRWSGGTVDAAGDHRIAMTACIAGCLGDGPVDVLGAECIDTSYPGFVADLIRLGGRVEVLEPGRAA